MRNLTDEEKDFLEGLLSLSPQNNNGYMCFVKNKKKYKRSRVLMQLYLSRKLETWEIVHHKDHNKTNDSIENLEVIDTKDFDSHASLHIAGKRRG